MNDSSVAGRLYAKLTEKELRLLAEYEGDAYEAVRLGVSVGAVTVQATAYVVRPQTRSLLGTQLWSLDEFVEKDLRRFMRSLLLERERAEGRVSAGVQVPGTDEPTA